MKKSLIALAALSTIAGSVAAQSSVTIYGRINPGYADQKITDAAGKVTQTQGYQANGWTSPRLGVNIVEDLGAGMSAIGTWEANIATESTAVGTVRQGFAGLKGSFGQVTIGNQYTTEYGQGITVAGTVNSYGFGSSGLELTSTQKKTATAVHRLGEISGGNSIRWTAPAVSGITFAADLGKSVSQATGASGGANTTDTQTDFLGLSANYKAGALDATLAYAEAKSQSLAVTGDYIVSTGTSSVTVTRAASCTASSSVQCQTITAAADAVNTKQKNWTASGTYTLGAAKLFAYYADRELTGTSALDYKAYNFGAQYAIGKFTPFAQMSTGKMKNAAGTTINDLKSTQVGVTYAFSPRTTGYAYVAEYKDDVALSYAGSAATTNSKKATATSVGISHNF